MFKLAEWQGRVRWRVEQDGQMGFGTLLQEREREREREMFRLKERDPS